MKTEDNQQSQPQVLKEKAIEQDIQADPVQSSSVVVEDTAVQTIDRRCHHHIVTLSTKSTSNAARKKDNEIWNNLTEPNVWR
eukprot:751219-Ditylum_brightwellii.AAC.1